MMNSIRTWRREHNNLFCVLLLTTLFVTSVIIATISYYFLPSEPSLLYVSNIQSTPPEDYNDVMFEEYDYIQNNDPIISNLRFGENLTFINTTQGGPSQYIIYTYNSFKQDNEDYYLRILHRIAISAFFKIESYVLQNDTWIYNSTIFKWKNPRDYSIFMYIDDSISTKHYGSVFDDLVISNSVIEKNNDWLDLGYSEVGLFKSIKGYSIILIYLRSDSATNAYNGIEEVSNNTKTKLFLTKVIFRVETFWQRYENHFLGWTTLMRRVYFLGNGMAEALYGFDNLNGINFMPN